MPVHRRLSSVSVSSFALTTARITNHSTIVHGELSLETLPRNPEIKPLEIIVNRKKEQIKRGRATDGRRGMLASEMIARFPRSFPNNRQVQNMSDGPAAGLQWASPPKARYRNSLRENAFLRRIITRPAQGPHVLRTFRYCPSNNSRGEARQTGVNRPPVVHQRGYFDPLPRAGHERGPPRLLGGPGLTVVKVLLHARVCAPRIYMKRLLNEANKREGGSLLKICFFSLRPRGPLLGGGTSCWPGDVPANRRPVHTWLHRLIFCTIYIQRRI